MTRLSLVAKSTPLGVVHLLTTLGEGPSQGVHIVLVVDVLAAPFQMGAILLPRLFPTLRARPLSTTLGPVAPCGALLKGAGRTRRPAPHRPASNR